MTLKFYVNGMCVDTYTCQAKLAPPKELIPGYNGQVLSNVTDLTVEDIQTISRIKRDAYRNYGYPPIIKVEA